MKASRSGYNDDWSGSASGRHMRAEPSIDTASAGPTSISAKFDQKLMGKRMTLEPVNSIC